MSERTRAALAALDHLIQRLPALDPSPDRERAIEETDALRRAVAAFHMEAIRFRMHAVDRVLRATGDNAAAREAFEEVRHELENAGFHTRSHAAP
jgi:hypothetical protein